jgi:hypothetical protein
MFDMLFPHAERLQLIISVYVSPRIKHWERLIQQSDITKCAINSVLFLHDLLLLFLVCYLILPINVIRSDFKVLFGEIKFITRILLEIANFRQ